MIMPALEAHSRKINLNYLNLLFSVMISKAVRTSANNVAVKSTVLSGCRVIFIRMRRCEAGRKMVTKRRSVQLAWRLVKLVADIVQRLAI